MRTIQQYKKQAKELFKEHKKTSVAVAAICIYTISFISFSSDNLMILFRRQQDLIGLLSSMLVYVLASAFAVGLASYTLEIVQWGKSEISTFLSSFENLFKVFLLQLLKTLFIFLWSLLFVVPGIIAAYRYAMAEFIMADNSEISPLEAISLSKKLMQGKKIKLFDLYLSFIGWYLLSAITCGIVGLYALPYSHLAVTNFYLDIKKDYDDELNFRAEWNARKDAEKTEQENDFDEMSSQRDQEDKKREDKKRDEWENYTWEHRNSPQKANGASDDNPKTYI